MNLNKFGVIKTDCDVGNHTSIERPCTNLSCPYPTHMICLVCNKFIGHKIDGVVID